MTGVLLALAAATGTYYLFTAIVLGWRGLRVGPARDRPMPRRRMAQEWLVQAGLADVGVGELVWVSLAVAAGGGIVGLVAFGAAVPALVAAACAGLAPAASYRVRRQQRQAAALEAWPRLIEEIRILTASLGRSIPQALFDAAGRAPDELRAAFDAARREWLLSTDFARTLAVLKAGLADPTADAVCETLLVAHEVGGSDVERRLVALAEDRTIDVQGRKDARTRQAGVRFARRFVLLVPVGMAAVGMTVGTGRAAYASTWGQAFVAAGIVAVAGCWLWAGRLLRLPDVPRVFYE